MPDSVCRPGDLCAEGVEEWLASLNWNCSAETADRLAFFLTNLIDKAERYRDTTAATLYHCVLDWLDERHIYQNRSWETDDAQTLTAAVREKLARFYQYVHRPVRAITPFASKPGENGGQNTGILKTSYDPIWMRLPVRGSARFKRGARVGVVVTCFNSGGAYIYETLASIARQTLPELDLVIIDDGCTDPYTVAYVRFLVENGYQVLRQANAGLARARNAGVDALAAEYLCCLDAGDLIHPEWLQRATNILDSDPGLGYVNCYYRTVDADSTVPPYAHPSLPEMLVQNPAAAVSVFRRAAWAQVSGYCPALKGMEDWDFWISILESGYRATVIPDVLFDHRSGGRPSATYITDTAVIERHRATFKAHWPDVISMQAQRFTRLLQARSAEIAELDRRIHDLEAALATHEKARELRQLDFDKVSMERESQRSSAAALKEALDREREHSASLERTLSWEREQAAILSASLERELDLHRPGLVRRLARNTSLLLSPRDFLRKTKNVALWCTIVINRNKRALWEQHFDRAWYERAHADVRRSGVSPVLHFLCCGHHEGRAASSDFDTRFYLERHPDVSRAGLNPLLHYVLYGARERRTTAPPILDPKPVPAATPRLTKIAPRTDGSDPLLTVVIPCFNYGLYLREAIESVQAQTLPNIETIVVEGGSTDGSTPAQTRELEARQYHRTQFLYRTESHLVGDNRNFGIERARGAYVCCLDADDRLKPVYLEIAAFLFESYGYDIVYPSVQFFGESDGCWRLNDADWRTIHEYNQVPTVAVFRKSVWKTIGGFRDWAKGDGHVAEDWDFWVRALRHGFSAKCIPATLMLYRVHNQGMWCAAAKTVDFQRHAIAAANVEVLARDPVPAVPARADWGRLLTSNNAEGAVLLALPFLTIGGAERVFEMITRALIQAGRRVVIITTLVVTEGVIDNTPHFETITPHVYPLPTLFGENTGVWDDFVSYLISRYSVETILIAGCDYMYQLLPDLMSTFPDVSIVDQLFNDQVHFPTNRHFSRYIDVTVVPTQKFADRIRDEFGEDPERVAVVPHGVEVPPVPDDAAIVGARKESGLPAGFADKFLIGFFGRMSPEKAPADFVEIAANLADDPAVAFVMTGEGPEFGRVRQSIVEHGLMNRIHTPGFVANVHELLKAVDVVVVPSTLDGMPLIVMEAQALAKPVVASTVGSIPAMIRDRETGFLCIPRDIAAFAARIRELHASPEVRATVGAKARRSVETQYGAEAMLTSYLKLFQAAVDHRHTPADHPHSSKRQPDQRPGREQSSLR